MQLHDPEDRYNPYSPPTAGPSVVAAPDDAGQLILADRVTRLGARLLDGVLLLVTGIPALGFLFAGAAYDRVGTRPGAFGGNELMVLGGLLSVLLLPLIGYQWYLLAKRGQTLGKRWTGIKIVKLDGSAVNFVSGVVLRNWVVAALGAVPYAGTCVGLVDTLMIFNDERRCLHDLIAGTKVVVVAGDA